MPYSPRCFKPEKYSADSRSVLLGTVPVLMQLPPINSARSIIATRLPKYAACAPAFSPAGPQPITIKSKSSLELTNPSVKQAPKQPQGLAVFIVEDCRRRRGQTASFLCGAAAVAPRLQKRRCLQDFASSGAPRHGKSLQQSTLWPNVTPLSTSSPKRF